MPLTSNHFAADPASVRMRLELCLTRDPYHIVPGSKGPEVARIQKALSILGNVPIAQRELDAQSYGSTTVDAVWAFKKRWNILNYKNALDPIVGIHTLGKLDSMMKTWEDRNAPPLPEPPPVAGSAGVQIGPVGPRRLLIESYYRNCGLETIGPGQIVTAGIQYYATLEDLIDTLRMRSEMHQVVLNHGHSDTGLKLRCCKETSYDETGNVMYLLSGLADMAEKGPIDPEDPIAKVLLRVAKDMRVSQSVVLRLVDKLVEVRKKRLILHFRACHLADSHMIESYRKAFGARMITYHACSILFFQVRPVRFKSGHSPAEFTPDKNSETERARVFIDPLGMLPSLVIVAEKIERPWSFLDGPVNPAELREWAAYLVRWWRGDPEQFVIPVMWEEEAGNFTWYCPLEEGWRRKLQYVV